MQNTLKFARGLTWACLVMLNACGNENHETVQAPNGGGEAARPRKQPY